MLVLDFPDLPPFPFPLVLQDEVEAVGDVAELED